MTAPTTELDDLSPGRPKLGEGDALPEPQMPVRSLWVVWRDGWLWYLDTDMMGQVIEVPLRPQPVAPLQRDPALANLPARECANHRPRRSSKQVRARVYETICEEPGATRNSLCQAHGLGWTSVGRALEFLLEKQAIVQRDEPGCTRYFPFEGD